MSEAIDVRLSPDELRYVIACGAALAQNVPESSLPTYCHFNKAQIIEFSVRMRAQLDDAGYDI
ncbi:hypothetical protein [Dyella sp. ASV21]|uniref:hypothetical protein n=1 Tax=Dyella sp. ASV21 TaxID=2795114 RepID=UPI0018ED2EF6|nr:hypothetical protein [Dyella sp. ASV21]